jgi:hypothetical protein
VGSKKECYCYYTFIFCCLLYCGLLTGMPEIRVRPAVEYVARRSRPKGRGWVCDGNEIDLQTGHVRIFWMRPLRGMVEETAFSFSAAWRPEGRGWSSFRQLMPGGRTKYHWSRQVRK